MGLTGFVRALVGMINLQRKKVQLSTFVEAGRKFIRPRGTEMAKCRMKGANGRNQVDNCTFFALAKKPLFYIVLSVPPSTTAALLGHPKSIPRHSKAREGLPEA